jgi:phage gp29-like protein
MAAKAKRRITAGGNFGKTQTQTIVLSPTVRFGLDLGGWMSAIKSADAIDWPRRVKLCDMYEDIQLDTHVQSVMEKYKSTILAAPLQFQRKGKVDDRIQEIIESPWFGTLLEDFLMEPWTGVGGSLFQFYRDGQWLKYNLIQNKHVDAINRVIKRNQHDMTGHSWDEFEHLLHIGDPRQIGKFAAIAYWVIVKRNNVGDWIQLAEIFGRPLTDATYDPNDTEARQKLQSDIASRGSMTAFIHPTGTELKLIEAAGLGGGADVYERLHVTSNSEISKMVLGNTLSTEVSDKGTQALGTVQHEDQKDVTDRARRRLLHILNYELTDIFQTLGFNTKGGKFLFVPKPTKNLATDIQVDQQLVSIGVPLGDDYFYEYYGRPKPTNYDELKEQKAAPAPTPPGGDPGDDDEPVDGKPAPEEPKNKSFKNRLSRFFGEAPGKGALEW